MFDFGWAELLLICGIALFVIGPKDIPAIAYQIGKFFRRIRYMQYAITGQFDDFMAKAEAKQHPMPEDEKMELDHDPYDEAEADNELLEMMPLPTEEKKEKSDDSKPKRES
jgi:sec-independent protein translocase protein TatB